MLADGSDRSCVNTNILIRLFFLITILTQVLLIILILKVTLLKLVIELFKLESLASKPVNRTRNELLLDILSKLVVQFKAFLDI
jgi:hypothetical protein